jgi:hypothetical protein
MVELGLLDVSNKGRAVMIAVHAPLKKRYIVYHKAFKYITDTDGLRVLTRNGQLTHIMSTSVSRTRSLLTSYEHGERLAL